jgi:hypothetical protein
MAKITARVEYRPAHWNRVAMAHIPGGWSADVLSGLRPGQVIYTDGCASREEAIGDLIAMLRDRGMHGTLKLARW